LAAFVEVAALEQTGADLVKEWRVGYIDCQREQYNDQGQTSYSTDQRENIPTRAVAMAEAEAVVAAVESEDSNGYSIGGQLACLGWRDSSKANPPSSQKEAWANMMRHNYKENEAVSPIPKSNCLPLSDDDVAAAAGADAGCRSCKSPCCW
jgi:hypothetical protein